MFSVRSRIAILVAMAGLTPLSAQSPPSQTRSAKTPKPVVVARVQRDLSVIKNVVVIFAENRSFDMLYGTYPGASNLRNVKPSQYQQRDRNGTVLKVLPPIWTGLTAQG